MRITRTGISAFLANGHALDDVVVHVIDQEGASQSEGTVLGPQHDAVRLLLNRVGQVTDEEVRAAEEAPRVSWGCSDREPDPEALRRALVMTGQPTSEVLRIVGTAIECVPAVTPAAANALAIGMRAVIGAHVCTVVDFEHLSTPLAAAVGPVPIPASPLTAPVTGCERPVGAHLWTWVETRHTCSCERPFPGLSTEGTRVAKTIAAGSTDWLGCLEAAIRLDPNPVSVGGDTAATPDPPVAKNRDSAAPRPADPDDERRSR